MHLSNCVTFDDMGAVTSTAQKLFEMLDPAFPEDDSPKKKRSRKEKI